jgi:hypothetical protein
MNRMTVVFAMVASGFLALSAICQEPGAKAAEPDSIIGEYTGIYSHLVSSNKGLGRVHAEAKIIALGDGRYRAVLRAETEPPLLMVMNRDPDVRHGSFVGESPHTGVTGCVLDDVFTVGRQGMARTGSYGTFFLARSNRQSPTEGLEPPANALVLLPFKEGVQTRLDAWTNKEWKLLPDGSAQVSKGPNRTVADHGSGIFHIEFRCPFEPRKRGQGRGNSGVYFGGRYEIQVLDSFGLEPGMGDCGSIYGVAITRENACLPPLRWQTYDVIYTAPQKRDDGTFEPAVMTVFHNGIKIHENQPVPRTTTAAPFNEHAERGPLYLQDHGNPVCYRNIWFLKLGS